MALEPWYSIDVAAELIPMRKGTLHVWLHRHKEEFPPRILTTEEHPVRILTESECLKIREMAIIKTDGKKTSRKRAFHFSPTIDMLKVELD